jgi:hypothetical protein
MKEKNLIRPEGRVDLFQEEIDILLEDVHERLAKLLHYIDLGDRVIKGNYINSSVYRRIVVLRNLAAKLEQPFHKKETEDETRTTNRDRGHQSDDRSSIPAEE